MAKGDLKKQLERELAKVTERKAELERIMVLMETFEDAAEELVDLITNRGKA